MGEGLVAGDAARELILSDHAERKGSGRRRNYRNCQSNDALDQDLHAVAGKRNDAERPQCYPKSGYSREQSLMVRFIDPVAGEGMNGYSRYRLAR